VSPGVLGCSKAPGNVSGQVKFKGAPLKGGTVTFVTADQQSFLSQISEDGHYSVENVPAGPVKISVETETLRQKAKARGYKPPPGAKVPEGYKVPDPE